MPKSISAQSLFDRLEDLTVLDVRKDRARSDSGLEIPGAVHQKPFDAQNWWMGFKFHEIVVYCVHGHEVS